MNALCASAMARLNEPVAPIESVDARMFTFASLLLNIAP